MSQAWRTLSACESPGLVQFMSTLDPKFKICSRKKMRFKFCRAGRGNLGASQRSPRTLQHSHSLCWGFMDCTWNRRRTFVPVDRPVSPFPPQYEGAGLKRFKRLNVFKRTFEPAGRPVSPSPPPHEGAGFASDDRRSTKTMRKSLHQRAETCSLALQCATRSLRRGHGRQEETQPSPSGAVLQGSQAAARRASRQHKGGVRDPLTQRSATTGH